MFEASLFVVVLLALVGSGFSRAQDSETLVFEHEAMQGDGPSRRTTTTTRTTTPGHATKLNPIAIPVFSRNETYCFAQDKVLYPGDGKCYKLREQGPCPNDTEWLVLDKEEAIRPNGKLRPVCKTCPCCNTTRIFWPEDEQCHKLSEKQTLCPFAGTVLRSDPFGEGECACNKQPPHARYEPEVINNTDALNGVCYSLYRRGPCARMNILTASVLKGFGNTGRCTRDPCHDLNSRNKNVTYAVHAPDGQCYRLGTQGPCAGEDETFNVHIVDHTPQCLRPVNIIFQLPERCPTDSSGNCQQEINLPEDDKTTFAIELLMSAEKRKKRRTRNTLE